MRITSRVVKGLAVALICLGFANPAQSQSTKTNTAWPKQAIRIVVTFTPGGAPDILARVLAESWQQSLGVPVLVENRPGYGGNIGADLVAKSEPDGYTLLIGTVGIHAINGALYDKMSFHPVNDFTPISFLASTPNVLIVNKQLGITNLNELIELAKAKPNQLTFGSSGVGTSLHMSGELFKEMTGVQIRHIPYKGRAQSLPDLVSGRISLAFGTAVAFLPYVQSGKLKALAVTSAQASPIAPTLPTVSASGLSGFEALQWFGVFAPKGTPAPVLKKLSDALKAAVKDPEFIRKQDAGGATVINDPRNEPAGHKAFVMAEMAKWAPIIKAARTKLRSTSRAPWVALTTMA